MTILTGVIKAIDFVPTRWTRYSYEQYGEALCQYLASTDFHQGKVLFYFILSNFYLYSSSPLGYICILGPGINIPQVSSTVYCIDAMLQ